MKATWNDLFLSGHGSPLSRQKTCRVKVCSISLHVVWKSFSLYSFLSPLPIAWFFNKLQHLLLPAHLWNKLHKASDNPKIRGVVPCCKTGSISPGYVWPRKQTHIGEDKLPRIWRCAKDARQICFVKSPSMLIWIAFPSTGKLNTLKGFHAETGIQGDGNIPGKDIMMAAR